MHYLSRRLLRLSSSNFTSSSLTLFSCFCSNIDFFLAVFRKNVSKYVFSSTIHLVILLNIYIPAGIYLLKINSKNTRARSEICSELTIKTLASFWCLIVNSEHISHLGLMLSLTSNK